MAEGHDCVQTELKQENELRNPKIGDKSRILSPIFNFQIKKFKFKYIILHERLHHSQHQHSRQTSDRL